MKYVPTCCDPISSTTNSHTTAASCNTCQACTADCSILIWKKHICEAVPPDDQKCSSLSDGFSGHEKGNSNVIGEILPEYNPAASCTIHNVSRSALKRSPFLASHETELGQLYRTYVRINPRTHNLTCHDGKNLGREFGSTHNQTCGHKKQSPSKKKRAEQP